MRTWLLAAMSESHTPYGAVPLFHMPAPGSWLKVYFVYDKDGEVTWTLTNNRGEFVNIFQVQLLTVRTRYNYDLPRVRETNVRKKLRGYRANVSVLGSQAPLPWEHERTFTKLPWELEPPPPPPPLRAIEDRWGTEEEDADADMSSVTEDEGRNAAENVGRPGGSGSANGPNQGAMQASPETIGEAGEARSGSEQAVPKAGAPLVARGSVARVLEQTAERIRIDPMPPFPHMAPLLRGQAAADASGRETRDPQQQNAEIPAQSVASPPWLWLPSRANEPGHEQALAQDKGCQWLNAAANGESVNFL